MIPQDATGAAIVLSLVVPGFVYQVARRRFRGPTPDDRDVTTRILRAFAVSGVLAFVDLLILGPHLVALSSGSGSLADRPRLLALVALILLFVVPLALAVVEQLGRVSKNFAGAWASIRSRTLTTYDPTPTAWDFCFAGKEPGWVRVMTSDGLWIGGWFDGESYASSYPEVRELYIAVQFVMSEDGEFERPLSNTGGVYVRCDDIRVVEFVAGSGFPRRRSAQ